MNTFKRLVKEGKIGQLCKRGAWIVAGLGVLQILILFYSSWQVYKETAQNQAQQPYGDMLNFYIFPNVANVFQSAAATLFYFLILYSAGTVINSFFAPVENDITYESLDKEEALESGEETARTSK